MAIARDDETGQWPGPMVLDRFGHGGGGLAGADNNGAAARRRRQIRRHASRSRRRIDGRVEKLEQEGPRIEIHDSLNP